MEPGFLLSYWRPWDENSSLIDSWGDYLRDTSIAHYTAETIGKYINEASRANVEAIEEASQRQVAATKQAAIAQINAIKVATELLGTEIKKVREEIVGVNRRLDLSLEMQRTGLILQQNIADLLKIPDYEKERVNHITLGLQFLHNAENDQDLLNDALEEFLKAEALKKQDYFVLHRIGCIYLFAPSLTNPELAQDYFVRAGKYASIDSGDNAIILVNQLTNAINGAYTEITSNKAAIGLLAADSYEKAALSAYILGDDKKAALFQEKAVKYNDCPVNRFNYSKYLFRENDLENAKKQLEIAVDKDPDMLDNALCDLDISSNAWTIEFVERKVAEVDDELEDFLFEYFNKNKNVEPLGLNDLESFQIAKFWDLSSKSSYTEKRLVANEFHHLSSTDTRELIKKCSLLLRAIDQEPIFSFSDDEKNKIRILISPQKAQTLDHLQKGYDLVKSLLKTHITKVGESVLGVTIIDIHEDPKGWSGLMSTQEPIGRVLVPWDTENANTAMHLIKGDFGMDNMAEISSMYCHSPAVDRCRSCRKGGYSDWYLPSMKELQILANAHTHYIMTNDWDFVLSSNDDAGNRVLGMKKFRGMWLDDYRTKNGKKPIFQVWPVRRFTILKQQCGIEL